ncbi:MAG: hypothetical protein J0H01_38340 [Rhizobiales bacterium]|nr:hypothetical protein [Hyphomicrobiales bacterium]
MAQATAKKPPAWTFETLAQLTREELDALFRALPAPAIGDMDGEFISALPGYSNAEWRSTMASLGKDYWLGKSYKPEAFGGHAGHGLNRYRTKAGDVRRLSRFVWNIAPSTVDDRPSLVMHYSAFPNWGGGLDLIDEIRVAASGVYLGLFHTAKPVPGFTPRDGGDRSGIEFFFLSGPVSAFVEAEQD